MKTYTIYLVKEYQNERGEKKRDLQLLYQTENREKASKLMDTIPNHLARYTSKSLDEIKLSKKGYCCFVDILDTEEN